MGLQVIISGDDSEVCHTIHPSLRIYEFWPGVALIALKAINNAKISQSKLSNQTLRGSLRLKELEKTPVPALPKAAVAEPSENTCNQY
ncbi:hypothetical protein TNCV_1325781 [Trichonephila clavipes]|nr:hypothetical protein TNCV_1325781 [Trichonephila clavipes]